ncbi:MAG: molybdate ABC transporter substrate-binding protein [Chloroflexi bacterium]|nr:molybdate ABC transporter substrate-binding protein [Chloroflexota bacterium]
MKCFAVCACLLCLTLLSAGCAAIGEGRPTSELSQEVVVFAAASLTEAFTTVGASFEQSHPQSRVTFNFAGSQQLASQLDQGAQADLFASADQRQMEAAVSAGRIDPGAVVSFACNRLVVVASGQSAASLHGLAQPGVKVVIGAEVVPVGAYTLNFLAAAAADSSYGEAFRRGVLENVVSYEQNVRAVLSKVRLGEADAGIVYATDAQTAPDVIVLEIPAHLNQLAGYQIAPVRNGASSALAQQFVDLLGSPAGVELLTDAGFSVDCPVAAGRRLP